MTSALLGIDSGAGSLKATLINPDDGKLLGTASQPISTQMPQTGWSEQDPESWYQALCKAVPQALHNAGLSAHRVIALAVSAGAHIPVLLDAEDRPVRPAILWNDQRSALEAAELREKHGTFIEQTSLNRANRTCNRCPLPVSPLAAKTRSRDSEKSAPIVPCQRLSAPAADRRMGQRLQRCGWRTDGGQSAP